MASSSKNKGSRLEYKVRDALNKAFDVQSFQRTPGSGAYMGKSNFAKKSHLDAGIQNALGSDIICPEWFAFSIECKNYADKPNYHRLMVQNEPTLDGWLNEAINDAFNFKQTPMLVFQTTRKGTFVVLPAMFCHDLNLDFVTFYDRHFMICGFDDFIERVALVKEFNTNNYDALQEWLEPIYHQRCGE